MGIEPQAGRLGNRPTRRDGRWIPLAVAALVLVAISMLVVASSQSSYPAASSAAAEADVTRWPGAIRPGQGWLPVQLMRGGIDGRFEWPDGQDTALAMVDVTLVTVSSEGQPVWRLALAARPPRAAGLYPANPVISYGLVFETTGDGVGDYVVGISGAVPRRGGFRVWVTDVASGATEEQIGPPYGFPVEFAHPDEGDDREQPPGMMFTFLGGSSPPGLTAASPFYAWASVTAGEEGLAWDYAPDAAWLVADLQRK